MTTKDRNDVTPDNSVDFVEQKLRDIFDVVPVSIQPLKGHVDQNFLVEIDNAKFVFKLKEMKEGIFIEEFKSQIHFMMFLNGNGFVTPTIIPTLNGQMYHQEGDRLMYMLTFLEGVELYDLDDGEMGTEKLFEVGQLLAEIHISSETMDSSELSSMEGLDQESEWNMGNAVLWKEHLEYLLLEHKVLSDKVITDFLKILPRIINENRGIIHADFHDSNIILLSQPRHKDPKGKYGIIDYGETIASLFLFDVAITVSYFMMISTLDDFIERGACVLAGYLSKRSMSTGEKKAFFVCVCAAYCRELVLCNKDFHVQGRQNEYLMTSMATGWPQLKKLRTHPEEFHAVFEKVLDIGE